MRSSACDTLMRLCVRHVLCWPAFPLVSALRSTGSAAVGSAADCSATDRSALFVGFTATMLDNLAVGLTIIPIVYLITGIFRGIETLAFALFRVLIQKQEQGEL